METLLPQYEDMLNGNCCYYCLEPHFESDNRTPKSYGKPTLCSKCEEEEKQTNNPNKV
jgi:hypothetical protein